MLLLCRRGPTFRATVGFALVFRLAGICAAADEPAIKLFGRDGETATLTVTQIKALPRSDFEAKERDGTPVKYSGVEVTHLLLKVDAAQGDKLRGDWLRAFVAIDAKDGYRSVFSLAEFDPEFTDRKIYLVDTRAGAALGETQGPFQIVIPDEKRRSRWVRMVTEIRVLDSRKAGAKD